MLRSRLFFSEHAYRQRVKSPVEYIIGLVRMISTDRPQPGQLASALDGMGQKLFAPPNRQGLGRRQGLAEFRHPARPA